MKNYKKIMCHVTPLRNLLYSVSLLSMVTVDVKDLVSAVV